MGSGGSLSPFIAPTLLFYFGLDGKNASAEGFDADADECT